MVFLEFFINEVENTVKLFISLNNIRYIVSAWLVQSAATAILSVGIFDLKRLFGPTAMRR